MKFLLPLMLCCAVFPVGAQSFFGSLDYSLRGSVLFFPEDNGNASGPMPIMPSIGGSASYTLSDLVALELSLDIYALTTIMTMAWTGLFPRIRNFVPVLL
jgi:hypothetical protein